MSDMTLTKILRSVGLGERATVHGFRSSFNNWTLVQTNTPWAVSEAALPWETRPNKLTRDPICLSPPCSNATVGRLPARLNRLPT